MREDLAELQQSRQCTLVGHEQEDCLLQFITSRIGFNALNNAHRQRGCGRGCLKPGVLQTFCGAKSFVDVLLQHPVEEIVALGRYRAESGVSCHGLMLDFLLRLFTPPALISPRWRRPLRTIRQAAGDELVQDDPCTPHIALHPQLSVKSLWCHVQQRATNKACKLLCRIENLCQTEVDDLDRRPVLLCHHDVLRLEILVCTRQGMHEREGFHRLLHDILHESLIVFRLSLPVHGVNPVLQFSAVAWLHDL
mmetsp:Transcript_2415/g.3767  ORF Transcript_2415/g.3767 Transcript_2415/m.3767 type:complete len:251 (-) Transcript_2415:1170-1922(-)